MTQRCIFLGFWCMISCSDADIPKENKPPEDALMGEMAELERLLDSPAKSKDICQKTTYKSVQQQCAKLKNRPHLYAAKKKNIKRFITHVAPCIEVVGYRQKKKGIKSLGDLCSDLPEITFTFIPVLLVNFSYN